MNRAIAISKEHGFHEPAVPARRLPEDNPTIQRARLAGVDVELLVYGTSRTPPDPSDHGRNYTTTLLAELNAIEVARRTHWRDIDSQEKDLRFRVRAIQAEWRERDLQREVETLKSRLRQGDGGSGDWVDERDALLAHVAELERRLAALQNERDRLADAAESDALTGLRERCKNLEEIISEQEKAFEVDLASAKSQLSVVNDLLAEERLEHTTAFDEETEAIRQDIRDARERASKLEKELTDVREDYHALERAQVENAARAFQDGERSGYGRALRDLKRDEVAYLRGLVEKMLGRI